MGTLLLSIVVGVIAAVIGVVITIIVQRSSARSRSKVIIDEARQEAEMIKQKKLFEAREEELQIKADAEKAANAKMSKIQQTEARIKQRELQLNQQQGDIARKRNELDAMKSNLDAQAAAVDNQRGELDKLIRDAQDELEHISGLSVEEAKEKLIESLKD